MGKAFILYYDSDNEARLLKKKITDGSVIIEGKQYIIDQARPLLLKTGMAGSYRPLYIVKWNNIEPAMNINEKGMTLTIPKLDRTKPEYRQHDITPETLRKMMGMTILGNMIKTKKGSPAILMLIIGLVAGAMMMMSASLMGFL